MRSIIKYDSISVDAIRQDITDYKSTLSNYAEIQRNTPAAVLTLVDDLLAEFGSLLNYKYQMLRRETYLSTASLESSIFQISSMLGYNTNRPTCPIILMKYTEIQTRFIIHGTQVGETADKMPIVYFGESKFIEKGDLIQFCVGFFNTKEYPTLSSIVPLDGTYSLFLDPSLAKAVDNNNVKVRANSTLLNLSRDPEDFVVGTIIKNKVVRVPNEVSMLSLSDARIGWVAYREDLNMYFTLSTIQYYNRDAWIEYLNESLLGVGRYVGSALNYSKDLLSANIYLSNPDYYQGVNIGMGDSIVVSWIETDGYKFITSDYGVTIFPEYDYLTYLYPQSYGTNGDDHKRIKSLAPLYYTTLRRAVTELDYKYILEGNEYIMSAEVEKDRGVQFEGTVSITSSNTGDIYSVSFSTVYDFSYMVTDTDHIGFTTDGTYSIIEKLKYLLESTGLVFVTIIDEVTLKIVSNIEVFISEVISTSTSWTYTENIASVKPQCCTLRAYYVKHDTVDNPIILTDLEQLYVSNYLTKYKMVGLAVKLIVGEVKHCQISLSVKLTSPSLIDQTYDAIKNLLKEYELTLKTDFKYSEFLARAAQVQIIDESSGTSITPITAILPNQTAYDIIGIKSEYLKFDFLKEDLNVIG